MKRLGYVASVAVLSFALSTSAESQVQTKYAYDALGRLVRVTGPDATTSYGYDAADNRKDVGFNRNPVAKTDSLTVQAGQAAAINPLIGDTDADNDALTVTGVGAAANGNGGTSFTANSVTFNAYAGRSGPDSFTYTVSDGRGGSAVGTVNVTIGSISLPVASNSTATVTGNAANAALSLNLSGGAATSLTITSPPANGTANVSGTSILFTPTTAYSGQTSLQYTASNSGGTSAPATVTINVKPVVNSVSGTATVGSQSTLALYPVTNYSSFSLSSQPTYGTASISNSTLYYTPTGGAGQTDSFSYTATSPGGTSTPANISFNIIQGNRAPTANDQVVEQYQSTTTTLYPLANDTDADGDPLTLQSVGPLEFVYGNNGTPTNLGSVTKTGNSVSFTAPFVCNCATGSKYHVVRFSYTVADNKGATSTAKHAIAVYSQPVNSPPTANPGTTDPVWQNTNTWIYPLTNDTDPDGDALTIQSIDSFNFAYGKINGVDLTGPPADFGSVTNNGTYIAYRAPFLSNSGTTGSSYIAVVVYYTVSDGRGGTSKTYQIINVYGPG